jgi:hypothetical protein
MMKYLLLQSLYNIFITNNPEWQQHLIETGSDNQKQSSRAANQAIVARTMHHF